MCLEVRTYEACDHMKFQKLLSKITLTNQIHNMKLQKAQS
jgi:hypothetical protein